MTPPNPTEGVSKTPMNAELDRLIITLRDASCLLSEVEKDAARDDLRSYLAARDAKLNYVIQKLRSRAGGSNSAMANDWRDVANELEALL